jgi:hypothetical protein
MAATHVSRGPLGRSFARSALLCAALPLAAACGAGSPTGPSGSAPDPLAPAAPAAPSAVPRCAELPHARRVPVSTADALHAALRDARPGDLIELADGTYTGYFNVRASGTAEARITLCGTGRAVLQTGSQESGHALWLDGASYWTLSGLVLTNSLGGLQVSRGSHNVVQWVEVHGTGQHAVHISGHSSHNVVRNAYVHHTGRKLPEWGEGVYVGSWNGHWCQRTGCQPDRSDYNQVLDSRFGPHVTAEHVQLMEGTTGGVVRGNTFDGMGMGSAAAPWADAWVYVLGNGYVIEDNRGTASPRHGFDTWVEVDGWGRDNLFRRNTADVGAEGYGFFVDARAAGTRVACDNTVRNAGKGFANVDCR